MLRETARDGLVVYELKHPFRDGLRLLQRREDEEQAKLEALRGALDEAEAAVAAGELSDYSPALLEEIAGQESEVAR